MQIAHRSAVFAVAFAAALIPGVALGDYVFQRIDYQIVSGTLVPGGTFTQTWGINDNGEIAMLVADASDASMAASFVYQPSTATFTRLPDAPGGLLAQAIGINNAGTVVGSVFYPPDFTTENGFILSGGTYQIFARPGWLHTEPRAIRDDGLMTGWTFTSEGAASTGIAFIYDPSTGNFTSFGVAGALATLAQGMNAAGQIVGSSYAMVTPQGQFFSPTAFLREPNGTITSFRIDGQPTAARGINDNGLIAGWTNTPDGQRAFVSSGAGYQVLTCPTEVCPGLLAIGAEGINNLGQIVGGWFDSTDVSIMHGFIATPVSMPSGTTVDGAYVFDVDVVPNQTIFIDPKVALGYDYAVGSGDPLFASVRLPFGIGDNLYTLTVGGHSLSIAANEDFDFRAHGFRDGVAQFRVAAIETDAALDPANANAFPTGVSFTESGRFTGTMTPLCRPGQMRDRANPPAGRALVACGGQ